MCLLIALLDISQNLQRERENIESLKNSPTSSTLLRFVMLSIQSLECPNHKALLEKLSVLCFKKVEKKRKQSDNPCSKGLTVQAEKYVTDQKSTIVSLYINPFNCKSKILFFLKVILNNIKTLQDKSSVWCLQHYVFIARLNSFSAAFRHKMSLISF